MRHSLRSALSGAVALALALVMMTQPVLAAVPVVPEGYKSPFSDVKEGQWYYSYVASLNSRGIINGYDDGRFGAGDATRVGDAMIMVLKAAGCGDQMPVEGGHYASGYSTYAVKRSWLTEEEIPGALWDSCPRILIARLAAKALGLNPAVHEGENAVESPFADVTDGYLTALYQAGIVAGQEQNGVRLFNPDSSITRAEISAIVWQIREYVGHIRFNYKVLKPAEGVPLNSYWREGFALDGDRMTYTAGDGVTTRLGVDVSSYQGSINWQQVARDGIDFAMIRLGGRGYGTETGTIYEDTRFHTNVEGAVSAGLDVGVYFFSQAISAQEAREEAEFVVEQLKTHKITGPVAFDWENIAYDSARTDGVDSATLTAAAAAFCEVVQAAGYEPMVYLNPYLAYERYQLQEVAWYPFWLAQYDPAPNFYYGFQMWQYTDSARVNGIQGNVDLNVMFVAPEVG